MTDGNAFLCGSGFESRTYNPTVENIVTGTAGAIVGNDPGSVLPSTGGRGTTYLYLIGLALIATAGTGIILKKRKAA